MRFHQAHILLIVQNALVAELVVVGIQALKLILISLSRALDLKYHKQRALTQNLRMI